MDLLHTDLSLAEDHKALVASLPLGVCSGNVQFLATDSGDGIENQILFTKHEPQFPIPNLKLGSNDSFDHAVDDDIKPQKHLGYRPKGLYDPRRPFLQNPKYLDYMRRQRQELGTDGKPIWSEEVEAAFQDALMHIPPMGQKKCSQRGKPYGRNMLISEWILRATGEVRERKQVSSHIQVLDRFLKHIPEWSRLRKPTKSTIRSHEGRKFYHNSIEHMVEKQRVRGRGRRPDGHTLQLYRTFSGESDNTCDDGSSADPLETFYLHNMDFEMWVSNPDQPEHTLHNYTRLQSSSEASFPTPLEDVVDWRLSFPDLQASINDFPPSAHCEILLLTANFQLMDNFPPLRSKLGIGLELSFRAEDDTNTSDPCATVHQLRDWHSVTFVYQAGEQTQEPVCEKCPVSQRGQIRPFFQSRWWASTFTSLTETRKLAEDSKDPADIALANDRVHNFFRNLTIMQEIWATQVGIEGQNIERRLAILLWKFSEAPTGFVGTTMWQKLVPPPERFATNSPLPHDSDMDLPPLAIDAMIEGSPTHDLFDKNHFLGNASLPYGFYRATMEEPFCPDGFEAFKADQSPDLTHLSASFDLPSGQDLAIDHLDMSNQYPISMQDQTTLYSIAHGDGNIDGGVFEVHGLIKEKSALSNTSHNILDHVPASQPSPTNTQGHHPLARFDMKYHRVLQQQLESNDPGQDDNWQETSAVQIASLCNQEDSPLAKPEQDGSTRAQTPPSLSQTAIDKAYSWNYVEDHDEMLRSALLAASTTNGLGRTELLTMPETPKEGHSIYTADPSQTPHWESPLAFRPTLHSYHSFPGLEPHGVPHDHFGSVTNPQSYDHKDLSYVSAASEAEDSFTDAAMHAVDDGATLFTRTQSEPDLSSYQDFGLSTSQSQHMSIEAEAITFGVNVAGIIQLPPGEQIRGPRDEHDSLSQTETEQEQVTFSQNVSQINGLDVNNRLVEVKMEELEG